MQISKKLLSKYLQKTMKDLNKEYQDRIDAALKRRDYAVVVSLESEQSGANQALVCILRGALFESEESVKRYLKTKL